MKKFLLLLISFCLLSQLALAERPTNELPMYGGQHNPTVERNPALSRDFYTEDFVKAKSKAEEAQGMGYDFSPEYIEDLEKKLKL